MIDRKMLNLITTEKLGLSRVCKREAMLRRNQEVAIGSKTHNLHTTRLQNTANCVPFIIVCTPIVDIACWQSTSRAHFAEYNTFSLFGYGMIYGCPM